MVLALELEMEQTLERTLVHNKLKIVMMIAMIVENCLVMIVMCLTMIVATVTVAMIVVVTMVLVLVFLL